MTTQPSTQAAVQARQKKKQVPEWKPIVARYQTSHTRTSVWQVLNSFVPLVALIVLMYFTLDISYWLTLLLAVPAGGFLVRIFIIQHDCGHGSFFPSRKANDWVGRVSGVLTLTPYSFWRKAHSVHHAHASNLEFRGIGDVYTMTVDEYLENSWWERLKYRIYRNPVFLFLIAPTFLFVVLHRFGHDVPANWKREKRSVLINNLVWVGILVLATFTIGLVPFLMIYFPIIVVAASAGTWLFYVQHQFEETYWEHREHWDYSLAALKGSSYYKLPKILQWFTGNIGFHHIHHLSPRIPNYLLEKCHKENPIFQETVTLTLRTSIGTMFLSLWDEQQKRLIGFRQLRAYQR